jgi:ABC-2 type transport system ATP-binding protein
MIRAENLWKKFGRFEALRGLCFDVPAGSAFALIGANGAGKTTTIKVLMNILEPSSGRASILGVGRGSGSVSSTAIAFALRAKDRQPVARHAVEDGTSLRPAVPSETADSG